MGMFENYVTLQESPVIHTKFSIDYDLEIFVWMIMKRGQKN